MAELVIQNPSITSGDFSFNANAHISAIAGYPLASQGGGGGEYIAGTDLKIVENTISVNTNGNANNDTDNKRNFVEGSWTVASGYNCHAEGVATSALGYGVHAQGMWTCFSSNDGQIDGGGYGPIYWGDGAGTTVEGYCNATTATPFSGTLGEEDYGPVHGGILKVIGNGHVENEDHETDVHVHYPSDALIIYRDGTISAAGKISANGAELTLPDMSKYIPYSAQELAIGLDNIATDVSIAQGVNNSANDRGFAQGSWNFADFRSFAQGFSNIATAYSFAQGDYNKATQYSFAQGKEVSATNCSFAQGRVVNAQNYSHAFGYGIEAINSGAAFGTFNNINTAAFVIGNGVDDSHRSDIFVIYHDGSISAAGKISANGVELGAGGGTPLTIPVNIGTGNVMNMPIADYGDWGDNADGYLAIGNNSKVGNQSYVFGNDSVAQKNSTVLNGGNSALHDSMAQGWKNIAIERSQAFGYNSSAYNNSLAAGYSVVATNYSFAGGHAHDSTRGNIIANDHSFALGVGSNNEPVYANKYSFAFGYATSAYYYAFAFGKAIDVEGSDGHAVIGVGGYNTKVQNAAIIVGNGTNNARSNAFVVYNNGNVSAKNYKAEGYTQNNTYVEASVPKSLPNSGDNTMVVQKMFVCTSDPDIVAHVNLANGEGCIFFRVG